MSYLFIIETRHLGSHLGQTAGRDHIRWPASDHLESIRDGCSSREQNAHPTAHYSCITIIILCYFSLQNHAINFYFTFDFDHGFGRVSVAKPL
jgi:hypothetical protein